MPVAETMETEEVVELCREICREMVPNWDMGMGPRPGPGATARVENTHRKRERDRGGRVRERGNYKGERTERGREERAQQMNQRHPTTE